MLDTSQQSIAPNDLIKLILKMQVDLLWNGGIGTYIKSDQESHSDVGDRANDALRINGKELRAKIVGEGGNLGLTQLGRIEFALNGGRVNTDFVDNVGGVDCSDNEVNIKIFLNSLVTSGDLTVKQRNTILESMEDEVGDIVLDDAYHQSEAISVAEHQGVAAMKELIRFIHTIEKAGYLDRQLEYIPDDETLGEREKLGASLTRPELSVLVAYAKMILKEQLVDEAISDDSFHGQQLINYFPTELRRNYISAMDKHPLKAEIIATALANQMVNEMGCNFVTRLQEETGSTVIDVTNAYTAAREVFELNHVFEKIRQHDNIAPSSVQYEMIVVVRRSIRRLSRWLLRTHHGSIKVNDVIERYKADANTVISVLDSTLVESEVAEHNTLAQSWIDQGIDAELANFVSRLSSLYSVLDISTVSREMGTSVQETAKLYFNLGDQLSLHWFLKQINGQAVDNNWQALARAAFREDLDWQQRQLTRQVLGCGCSADQIDVLEKLDEWISTNEQPLYRWNSILNEFKVGSVHEFAKFSVALRELMLLNLNCSSNE
ncbi:NAD-specific glutamate dehydrogenase large form [Vibrio astriarenae]|nr:NAD-specific glutamate dehydrogenase large form [Vibrio sp. C7]